MRIIGTNFSSFMCEKLVPIHLTCVELVLIPLTSKPKIWYQVLTHEKNWHQFLTKRRIGTNNSHMWRISFRYKAACDFLLWNACQCRMEQLCGVLYRCEEFAWLPHEFWLRAYFSHTWKILVWNRWRIGTNYSRDVRMGTNSSAWNLRSVKNYGWK